MKQTAVEWLLDNLISEPYSEEDFNHNSNMWDKAKEMEKQQIIDAYNENENYMCDGTEGEQYYNETFNK
jgi:hypothetical protein